MATSQVTPPPGFELEQPATPPPGFEIERAAPPPPTATISQTPKGAGQYLQDLEGDFRYGTSRTMIGRLLSKMGAQGIDVGSHAGEAKDLMSPVTGSLHAAQGVVQMGKDPVGGALKTAGGVLEASTLPAQFMAPEAAEAASAIPSQFSTKKAGALLGLLEKRFGKLPVDVSAPVKVAGEMAQLGETGPDAPSIIKKFIDQSQSGQMDYKKARQFYSNLSRMSAADKMGMTGPMKAKTAEITAALDDAIRASLKPVAADQHYAQAMGAYARGAMAKGAAAKAIKYGIPGAAAAAGTDYAIRQVLKK